MGSFVVGVVLVVLVQDFRRCFPVFFHVFFIDILTYVPIFCIVYFPANVKISSPVRVRLKGKPGGLSRCVRCLPPHRDENLHNVLPPPPQSRVD